jgi:hypothetical protein
MARGYAGLVLSDLIAPARRVAVVGLAKNTGKTETLGAILRELDMLGRTVGVTSVGRDGEARDAIDARIEKPCIRLAANSLVATTDALLRASGLPFELVNETGVRTPLGRVVVARLLEGGAIEVAGPSAAQDVREVSDAMLEAGAQLVLVDGAIDRRAASSPAVCDGLVMCTGAVLHEQIDQVIAQTRDAVELVRLPEVEDARVRALACTRRESLLVDAGKSQDVVLPARFALTCSAQDISELLTANPGADHLVIRGALHEPFLRELLSAARGRKLEVVVEDPTKIFLSSRGCGWFRRQGVSLCVATRTRLCAVTLNPVAPRSHAFDSRRLRAALEEELGGVAILDVREPALRLAAGR